MAQWRGNRWNKINGFTKNYNLILNFMEELAKLNFNFTISNVLYFNRIKEKEQDFVVFKARIKPCRLLKMWIKFLNFVGDPQIVFKILSSIEQIIQKLK